MRTERESGTLYLFLYNNQYKRFCIWWGPFRWANIWLPGQRKKTRKELQEYRLVLALGRSGKVHRTRPPYFRVTGLFSGQIPNLRFKFDPKIRCHVTHMLRSFVALSWWKSAEAVVH